MLCCALFFPTVACFEVLIKMCREIIRTAVFPSGSNSGSMGKQISFHTFPRIGCKVVANNSSEKTTVDRRLEWIRVLRIGKPVTERMRVCSEHFKETDYFFPHFLPMKCGACSNIFCKDHFSYSHHDCNNAYQRDVQVPVCPLCNEPVPSKRGEQPDIAVGQHIDRDCQADPAVSKRKIYTNKCNVKGCKQKEVIRITCDICLKSYCLKHRHPTDHKCQEQKPPAPSQAAGAAAIARAKSNNRMRFPWQSNQSCASNVERRRTPDPMPEVSVTSVQGRFSEDEALAIALQNSMKETKPRNIQEEEDRLLAQALANSEVERVGGSQNHGNRDKCSIS